MTTLVALCILISLILVAPRIAAWIADKSSDEPPQRPGIFRITACLALLGLILGLGELTIPLFIIGWSIAWTVRLLPRWRASIPACLAIAVLAGHFTGHRIYGSPHIVDNRPLLPYSLEAASLEAPNIIICTDGSRHAISGTEFIPEVFTLSAAEQSRLLKDGKGQPIRFIPDPGSPSGYTAERRLVYWCGNSFYPSFFPRDLPSHRKDDLAATLGEGYIVKQISPTPVSQ